VQNSSNRLAEAKEKRRAVSYLPCLELCAGAVAYNWCYLPTQQWCDDPLQSAIVPLQVSSAVG
jgi:hypothetical protein